MASFQRLWKNHPGRDFVCDETVFQNQCAMRMGKALENSGIDLKNSKLKRCTDYDAGKFKDHKPGHIRSAQDLANVFYRNPKLLGSQVRKKILSGSINKNLKLLKNKNGLIFIRNGWGSTDHIDLWNGTKLQLKGSADTLTYRKVGEQLYFWELK